MRDAAAEQGVLAELLVDMQRIVIADQAGEQRDVAFADGAAARALRDVDFEIFEIETQGLSLVSSAQRNAVRRPTNRSG